MNNDTEIKASTIDDTKRFLKRYRKNRELVSRLKIKLSGLEDRLLSIRSPNLSGMPRGSLPTPIEDIISDKDETIERLKRLEARGKQIRLEILERIDTLDNVNQVSVLEAFCIDCKTFEIIADDLGYSERRVIAIYTEAIRQLNNTCLSVK